MEMFLIVATAFGIIMLAMAVGVIVSNRPLRGSCGGPAILDNAGNPMTCPDCNCKTEIEIGVPPEPGVPA
jgi:hypothetical protein